MAQLIACCLTVVAITQAGAASSRRRARSQGLLTARNGAAMTVRTATGNVVVALTAADRTAALEMTKELT
jgi:hypothetical protein